MWMQDYVTNVSANAVTTQVVQPQFYCFLTTLAGNNDPVTFTQAVQSNHWIAAMNVQLDALEENGTWDIVDLPPRKQTIGSRWLYKTKYNPDESIERYKSRLVILGN